MRFIRMMNKIFAFYFSRTLICPEINKTQHVCKTLIHIKHYCRDNVPTLKSGSYSATTGTVMYKLDRIQST